MIRLIKRRLAIRSYVWKLSQELFRRFGKKHYYSTDEVTQAAQRSALLTAFSLTLTPYFAPVLISTRTTHHSELLVLTKDYGW